MGRSPAGAARGERASVFQPRPAPAEWQLGLSLDRRGRQHEVRLPRRDEVARVAVPPSAHAVDARPDAAPRPPPAPRAPFQSARRPDLAPASAVRHPINAGPSGVRRRDFHCEPPPPSLFFPPPPRSFSRHSSARRASVTCAPEKQNYVRSVENFPGAAGARRASGFVLLCPAAARRGR